MDNNKNFNLILFDLDGTLTDPGIGITNSVAYALTKMGISPPSRQELYKFIGPPLKDSFHRYYDVPESETMYAVELYREYFSEHGIFENEVYAGVREMLTKLRAAGKKICLATSKPDVFAEKILKHFDLWQYFDFLAGATMDETRTSKHDVIEFALKSLGVSDDDRAQVLMVGDREHDIIGAKKSGVASAGVTFGYGSREELMNAGADYLVGTPEELAELVLN